MENVLPHITCTLNFSISVQKLSLTDNKSIASRSIIRPKDKPVLKVTVLLRLYEKNSLNNRGVICTRIFKVFRKMWLPWQCLVLSKLSHLYAQLHINIHPCKYEEISWNNGYPHKNFKVFRKMWLPWQRLVLPKLSHLYAQLHINIIHPCKYEEISINNKWGVIRTRILKCFY